MAAAGYGAVGEFHYVHHQPDGTPYDEPNAMAIAVAEAARAAGLRDRPAPGRLPPRRLGRRATCRRPRASAASATRASTPSSRASTRCARWAAGREGVHVGVAAHSVRAVPASWLEAIAAYAEQHGLVRHVHAHEQPRELEECRAEHGVSPIELLDRTGFLGPRTSVIHGIHVDAGDVRRLAESDTIVVSCPTTEGSLGDGHFPALAYRDAGVRIAIGSDSQVRVDPFEEARELETLARRERRTRHALLAAYGDLWGELAAQRPREPRARRRRHDRDRPRPPRPARVADADLPLAVATCASAAVVCRRAGAR